MVFSHSTIHIITGDCSKPVAIREAPPVDTFKAGLCSIKLSTHSTIHIITGDCSKPAAIREAPPVDTFKAGLCSIKLSSNSTRNKVA